MTSSSIAQAVEPSALSNFKTFVWLRWRIRVNQIRQGSAIGKAIAAILLISFAMTCLGLLVTGVLLGFFLPRSTPSEYYFLYWDAFVAFFCLMWFIRIATDLQRTDAITFDRILQLPLAFSQAFVINYLSSLVNFTFVALCSFGFGFWFGSCFSIGPKAILFPIPFVCFLVAISALTYQMQGWLAALMSNPRRRQMVMILVPFCVILVSQVPAILATRFAKSESQREAAEAVPPPTLAEKEALPESNSNTDAAIERQAPQSLESSAATDAALAVEATAKEIEDAATAKAEEARLRKAKRDAQRAANRELWLGRIRSMNLWFPPLWMAGCVESMMAGTIHCIWLTGAMALVGFVSLRRNYQQTLRYYKGETDTRASAASVSSVAVSTQTESRPGRVRLVEREIPYVSEETAAVMTMTWQTMTRAPEVKLYLLLPLIIPFILFGVLQTWQMPPIDELKAAIIVGFTASSLFITSGMLGNCFAYDRSGFRAFVLSPIRRDRILLGRNLATMPFLLLQSMLLAIAIGAYFGMSFEKLLAAVLLSASILPPFCLVTNIMAIVTPFPLAAGSIQPKQFNLVPVVFSLLLSMIMPVILGIALLPLGLEWSVDKLLPSVSAVPISLVLSVAWLIASLVLYRWALPWQGKLLANRETELLRIVTSKVE